MKEIKVAFIADSTWIVFERLAKYYKIVQSDKPDFVFYNWLNCESLFSHEDAIKIYVTLENTVPNFNYCDYAIGTHHLDFGARYHRFPFLYLYFKDCAWLKRPVPTPDLARRKFCNFIYGNASNNKQAQVRIDFCKQLMKYKRVDCPGPVLNNMPNALPPRVRDTNWQADKVKFLRDYKFTIAFENDFASGYSTEKMIHPLQAHSVPIYKGDPEIASEINTGCMINCADYKNFDEVIERIIYLDNNDEEYLKLLEAPCLAPGFNAANVYAELDKFLINIIEHGKKQASDLNASLDMPSSRIFRVLEPIKEQVMAPFLEGGKQEADQLLRDLLGARGYPNFASGCRYGSLLHNLASKVKNATALGHAYASYLKAYKDADITPRLLSVLASAEARLERNGDLQWLADREMAEIYREFLVRIWPQDFVNRQKEVLGEGSAACALLKPDKGAAFISVGIAGMPDAADRDHTLAEQGHKVIQLDPRLGQSPKSHVNLEFMPKQLDAYKTDGKHITLDELLKNHQADTREECVLLLNDPVSAEEFLRTVSVDDLAPISQIIFACKGLTHHSRLSAWQSVFEKILKTHAPIHIHFNNAAKVIALADLLIADEMAISFASRAIGPCADSGESFPASLDKPVSPQYPDIFIGSLESIISSAEAPCSPAMLARFTQNGQIPARRGVAKNTQLSARTLAAFKDAFSAFGILFNPIITFGFESAPEKELKSLFNSSHLLINAQSPLRIVVLHDILGKQGLTNDKPVPDGDLIFLDEIRKNNQEETLLFFAEPVGRDMLLWDWGRIYGKLRLPHLLKDWAFLASFGLRAADLAQDYQPGSEPVFVISGNPKALNIPPSATAKQKEMIHALNEHGAFDREYYLSTYPDVLTGQMDAVSHYVMHGANEDRQPAKWFVPQIYKKKMGNLDWHNINPFLHYLLSGRF